MQKPANPFLLRKKLCEVIDLTIPRLQTLPQCAELEQKLHTMWKNDIADDAQYYKWMQGIQSVRNVLLEVEGG